MNQFLERSNEEARLRSTFIPHILTTKSERGALKIRSLLLLMILLCMFTFSASGQKLLSQEILDYHLSWDGKSTRLSIDLFYDAEGKDSTIFVYKDWVSNSLVEQTLRAGSGDKLSVQPGQGRISIGHTGSGIKQLHYELDGTLILDTKRARANELFRPVIMANSLYMRGANFCFGTPDARFKSFAVTWDKVPNSMTYFNSAAPEATLYQREIMTLHRYKDILLIMGKDIKITKYQLTAFKYYLVTSKRDTINDIPKIIEPYFRRFFPSARSFWKDTGRRDFFIAMLPLNNLLPATATGLNLGTGFISKYSGQITAATRQTIGHEISHTWIPNAVGLESTGMENVWFNEGFNDYIALFHLARTRILDQSEFLGYVNGQIREHYSSPARTAPADSIEKHFWTSKQYERLSYQRGMIFAFYLDNQIRLASLGKYNIRHFLLALVKKVPQRGSHLLLVKDFADVASGFLPGTDIQSEVNRYLLRGEVLDFHQIGLIKEFKMIYVHDIPVLTITHGADLTKVYNWRNDQ